MKYLIALLLSASLHADCGALLKSAGSDISNAIEADTNEKIGVYYSRANKSLLQYIECRNKERHTEIINIIQGMPSCNTKSIQNGIIVDPFGTGY